MVSSFKVPVTHVQTATPKLLVHVCSHPPLFVSQRFGFSAENVKYIIIAIFRTPTVANKYYIKHITEVEA